MLDRERYISTLDELHTDSIKYQMRGIRKLLNNRELDFSPHVEYLRWCLTAATEVLNRRGIK